MTYCGCDGDLRAYFRKLRQELDACDGFLIPQIGFAMTHDGSPQKHYEHRVAAGEFDAQIEVFCRELKALGRPAFVRIGYEFNGRWNGYVPETYIPAWRRVVAAMRAHRLDDVAAVWCYASDIRNLPDLMDWYPGDEWVDWWSIDLFSNEHFWLADTVKFMKASVEHGFPVMIGESTPRFIGVLDGETSWQRWFAPYFDFMRRWPNTKGFCYIAWEWSPYPQWHDWGDGRIWKNEWVNHRYQEAISTPAFIHRASERKIRKRLRACPALPVVPEAPV
jgi:hypothetical protein